MSKYLEALENIKQDYCKYKMCPQSVDACQMCDIGIIETALRGYSSVEKENKILREKFENRDETYFDTWSACERLKENSNHALMFVDSTYCLVDTEDNKFDIIDTYKVNSKGIIDDETQKKLKAFEIIKDKRVDIGRLYAITETYPKKYQLECYNDEFFIPKRYFLTQEEFDLLKEILL